MNEMFRLAVHEIHCGAVALLTFTLVALVACQVAAPAPATTTPVAATFIPTATRVPISPTPVVSTEETNFRVEIAIFESSTGRTAISAPIGSSAALTVAFRPYKDVITTRADGTQNRYSTDWQTDSIREMRYCSGPGRECTLPDRWVPFTKEQRITVPVEWVGLRDFGLTAQFRDASGKTISAGHNRGETTSQWVPITGVLDTRTPVAAQPPAIQTAIAQAQAAFPVTGTLNVGDQPRMGGKAGSSVTIPVYFQAASPVGTVTGMRIKRDVMGRCLTPEEMADAPWEPFVGSKTYQTSLAINFTTFKVHVQYRDDKGNVSQVYCGEVVLEGSP